MEEVSCPDYPRMRIRGPVVAATLCNVFLISSRVARARRAWRRTDLDAGGITVEIARGKRKEGRQWTDGDAAEGRGERTSAFVRPDGNYETGKEPGRSRGEKFADSDAPV
jgi:hypothetical protein